MKYLGAAVYYAGALLAGTGIALYHEGVAWGLVAVALGIALLYDALK